MKLSTCKKATSIVLLSLLFTFNAHASSKRTPPKTEAPIVIATESLVSSFMGYF